MAFPPGDVAPIDRFNRANGAPATGEPTLWATSFVDGTTGGLTIVDQKLTATGADGGGYTLESETDFVRIIDIAASSGGYLAFGWRLGSPGSGAWDSYAFVGQGTTWEIRRYDNGTPTVLASEGVESSLTALDKIGVRVVGSTHEVYLFRGGAWDPDPVLAATDATYASGAFWLQLSNASWQLDNYLEGDLLAPTAPVTIVVDADHPDASDEYTRVQGSTAGTPFLTPQAACAVARATPSWADTVLVKPSTEGNADPTSTKNTDVYPAMDHRWTDRDDDAPGWLFGDNDGNLPITIQGETGGDMPMILKFMTRGLRNWEVRDVQFGYPVTDDDARANGTGWDYSTLSTWERVEDLKFYDCLFTGGAGIAAHWAGELRFERCTIHAPLPPDGGNPGFHDGAGIRTERSPNDSAGGFSVGQIYVIDCEISNVRGDDGVTVGGVFADDEQYDTFDMVIEGTLFWNVTEGPNPAFHTDSIQALAVPRCRVSGCTFIGNATSFMASDGRNGEITFENNLVVAAGSPFQMQGTDVLIMRHNTFFHTTSLRDATLLFYQRAALPEKTRATIVNNIIGGFYMRNEPIADYFHEDSTIEDNLIITRPGLVTPFGTNLPGIPEFGNSARLDTIPNQVFEQPGLGGEPGLTLARTWELANTPVLSPGIGEGQATSVTHDLLGRAFASPPDVGCFQSDPGTLVSPIARGPYVVTLTPSSGATGVAQDVTVTAALYPKPGEEIDPATITNASAYVQDAAGTTLPAVVTLAEPDENGYQLVSVDIKTVVDPPEEGFLFPLVTYTGTLTTAIEDTEGSALEAATSWTFRIAGPAGPAVSAGGEGGDLGDLSSIAFANRTTDEFEMTLNGATVHVNGTQARQLQKALAKVMSSYSGRENKDLSATVTIGPLT